MSRRPEEHPLEDGRSRAGIRAELEHYLEERAREFEAQGMDADEARRAAEAAFGDVDRIESEVRREDGPAHTGRGGRWRMEDRLQDLRFALRGALRNPGLTALVVATLGLGIGAATAIFTVVNASLLRALPFPAADELVFLQGAYAAPDGPQIRGASFPEASDWRDRSRSFSGVAAFDGISLTLTGTDQAERIAAESVGTGYFDILRVEPMLGRTFTVAEHALDGSGMVVVLGEDLWTNRFGRDRDILGRTLTMGGRSFTVVGVLPRTFPGASLNAELWIPLEASGSDLDRGSRYLGVVARLVPGVTVDAAQRDLEALAATLESEHPETHEDRVALVTPMREVYMGSTRTLVLAILSATGLLLVIAAANVTNLLLVRASARRSEMLVRTAMGARRGRIRAQLVTESLVLAALGALAGLGIGIWGARALAGSMPDQLLPAYAVLETDWRVLGFTAALMALVGIFGGLAPALQASRVDIASGLRTTHGRGRRTSLQHMLVVGEVALAFLLLVGAGLMSRSFLAQLAVDPGYDVERLHAFSLQLPGASYPDEESRRSVATELLARLEARPEITSASLANDAPLVTGYSASYIWTEGSTEEDRIRFYRHFVMPGYFETLGIRMLAGRPIAASDEAPVAVISRAMAERHYTGRDPIGENLRWGGPDGEIVRIIGVAEDVRYRDLTTDLVGAASDPDVFLPWPQVVTSSLAVVSRTEGDPAALERVVRQVVAAVDPDLPVFNSGPLARGIETQTAQGRFGTLLLGVFGALAVLLCALGLYGVLAFSVARRTRELAVRVAVGAPVGGLRWLVVRQGMTLVAVGLGIGLVAAAAAAQSSAEVLEALLFDVRWSDPTTYAAVTALLAAVALAATWIPAVRATRVDPQSALKAD